MDKQQQIGPAIRAARKAAGLTQIDLAEALGLGRDGQCTISDYETGRTKPGTERLFAIGRVLGLAVLLTADGVQFVDPAMIVLPPEGD